MPEYRQKSNQSSLFACYGDEVAAFKGASSPAPARAAGRLLSPIGGRPERPLQALREARRQAGAFCGVAL
jgi:hypothetical protein